jgi:hypothetical protein
MSTENGIFLGTVNRFVKILRYGMTTYVDGRTQGVRIKMVVVESYMMPKEIFVYQRKPSTPPTRSMDEFVNIASPNDLEEYSVNEPSPPGSPFFRLAEIDLVFRSPSHAQDALEKIVNDVGQLVESLNFMDGLALQEEIVIGNPSVPSSSSSTAPSSSSSS